MPRVKTCDVLVFNRQMVQSCPTTIKEFKGDIELEGHGLMVGGLGQRLSHWFWIKCVSKQDFNGDTQVVQEGHIIHLGPRGIIEVVEARLRPKRKGHDQPP